MHDAAPAIGTDSATLGMGAIQSLFSLESSWREWRLALGFAALLLVITLMSWFTVGWTAPMISGPTFFATCDVVSACFDWVTAFLLIVQVRQTGSATMLCVAAAYMFNGGTALLHLLSVPGLLFTTSVFGTANSAPWIRVCWYLGLPVGALASVAVRGFAPMRRPARALVVAWAVATLLLVLLFAMTTSYAVGALPNLEAKAENSAVSFLLLFPVVLGCQISALVALWRTSRARSLLGLWLMLAVLSGLCEFVIGWVLPGVLPERRFSFNFYLARCAGLSSSSILLMALLDSVKMLYGNLVAGQQTLERRVAERTRALRAMMGQRDQVSRESRLWADAFRHAPIGISFHDPAEGEIRFVNPAYATATGMSVDEARQIRLEDAFAEEERPGLAAYLAAADRTGHVNYQTRLLRKDGTAVPVEMDIASIRDAMGTVIYRVASSRDITERLEQETELARQRAALERSNADLESFAYVASHDLKAPLRAITHLVEWIGEDLGATASVATLENLELLRGRAARLQTLLDGLLAYSRVGRQRYEVEELDVAGLVEGIVAVTPLPPGFVVACDGPMPRLRTHRTPMREVLENLIGNALKHHDRAEGRVTVAMRVLDGVATFRVQDDGPGIPPRFQERIFLIFQTLASRDEVEGSGMGLAIVKKKIEGHGGRIWVESQPPARGAAFIFTWREAPAR